MFHGWGFPMVCGDLTIGLIVIRPIGGTPLAPVQSPAGYVPAGDHLSTDLSGLKRLCRVPRPPRIHPHRFLLRIFAATQVKKLSKGMRLPSGIFVQLRHCDDIRHFLAKSRVVANDLFSLAPDELFSSEPISILATNRYVRWGKPIGAFWAVKR